MTRYARRVDANHAEIKAAFEKMGCRVADTSRLGSGFPDIVVQWGGITMLIEIKTEKGKLTGTQKAFNLMMRLVRNVDDVAETVAVIRKWHWVIRNNV